MQHAPPAGAGDRAGGVLSPAIASEIERWLEAGCLTLVDGNRTALTREAWRALPQDVRRRAMEDFARIVRGGAKAAVIFLRNH